MNGIKGNNGATPGVVSNISVKNENVGRHHFRIRCQLMKTLLYVKASVHPGQWLKTGG